MPALRLDQSSEGKSSQLRVGNTVCVKLPLLAMSLVICRCCCTSAAAGIQNVKSVLGSLELRGCSVRGYQSRCSQLCLGHRSMTAPAHQTSSASVSRNGNALQPPSFEYKLANREMSLTLNPEPQTKPRPVHVNQNSSCHDRAWPSSPNKGRKPATPSSTQL